MRNEKGDANLIIAALFLPILTLLFAAALDLLRLPLGQLALEEALAYGSRDAELDWPGKSPAPSSVVGIEPFQPAAVNFCEIAPASNTSCVPSSTDNGVINASIAASYVSDACNKMLTHLSTGTGLVKFSSADIYIQCAIYKTSVASTATGYINASPTAVATTSVGTTNLANATGSTSAACGGGAAVFNPTGQSGIASCLTTYIKSLPCYETGSCSSTSEVAGGWNILGASSATWFDSYWFTAVAYLKVNSYFSSFSQVGGSNSAALNQKVITSYVIMPWTNLSAIDDNA